MADKPEEKQGTIFSEVLSSPEDFREYLEIASFDVLYSPKAGTLPIAIGKKPASKRKRK